MGEVSRRTSVATTWGVTAAEQHRTYPCDALLPSPSRRLLRGIDVAAPSEVVYRWLCQLRVAPYSYDWIDNGGRRSPRTPLPWCWDLEVGQRFARVFTLDSFTADRQLTLRMAPGVGTRLFGDVALSYVLTPVGPGRSRLVAALRLPAPTGRPSALRAWLLAWGDLVMMRRQLRTFARLAGADAQMRAQPSV